MPLDHVQSNTAALPPPPLPLPPSGAATERGRARRWEIRALPAAWHPFLILLGAGLVALGVRFCLQFHVPLPFCILRRTTGLPCPGCGSTRSLAAWAHLDPLSALRFNPLLFCAVIGLVLWLGAVVLDQICGTRLVGRAREIRRRISLRVLLALVVLNWLYLCLTLPP
jgi:hypothetical protein